MVPLLVPQAAVAVEKADPAGGRADVPGPVPAAFDQVTQGGIEGGDARPPRLQGGRGSLEDPHVASGIPEHQRRGQATERAGTSQR
jgi:hypothetical protein